MGTFSLILQGVDAQGFKRKGFALYELVIVQNLQKSLKTPNTTMKVLLFTFLMLCIVATGECGGGGNKRAKACSSYAKVKNDICDPDKKCECPAKLTCKYDTFLDGKKLYKCKTMFNVGGDSQVLEDIVEEVYKLFENEKW